MIVVSNFPHQTHLYMTEEDIRFDRALVAIDYLERQQFVPLADKSRLGVRAPAFLG
jgi:hypothetical protein